MSTVLQATYQFQPQISIEYNEERKLFLGRMIIRGISHDFEGPTSDSVALQMDDTLLEEYRLFERSIEQPSRGLSLGGGNERDVEYLGRERTIEGERGQAAALGPLVKGAWHGMEYGSILQSLLTGNYLDIAATLLLGFAFGKGNFSALVGGRKITAKSRHKLRKEVERMRNRILQEIMSAIRLHNKSREIAVHTSTRLSIKKEHAKAHWEGRVSGSRPKAEDWRGRVLTLRHGIEIKRLGAEEQWVGL